MHFSPSGQSWLVGSHWLPIIPVVLQSMNEQPDEPLVDVDDVADPVVVPVSPMPVVVPVAPADVDDDDDPADDDEDDDALASPPSVSIAFGLQASALRLATASATIHGR